MGPLSRKLIDRLGARFGLYRDEPPVRLRIRTHLEKYDHTGPTPRLVEYLVAEEGTVVHRETYSNGVNRG